MSRRINIVEHRTNCLMHWLMCNCDRYILIIAYYILAHPDHIFLFPLACGMTIGSYNLTIPNIYMVYIHTRSFFLRHIAAFTQMILIHSYCSTQMPAQILSSSTRIYNPSTWLSSNVLALNPSKTELLLCFKIF